LGCHSEGWRRAMSATAATAVCLVVAAMVGEASRYLTKAYGLELARRGEASVIRPSHRSATTLPVEERADLDAAFHRVAVDPVLAVRRPRLPRPKPVSAVMSADFPYRPTVMRAAARHAIDPSLVLAIIASESRGDPEAVSPAGAIGLMQLMPATATELGVDPWKPDENIEGAVRYLALLLEEFKSVDLSLVAYNAGPGFAERYRQGEVDLGAETRAFIMRVAGLQ